MADDHQVTRVPVRPVEGTPRPTRAPQFPDDPDTARREIQATRARMSDTLDEIEGVLLRKKEQVRERMDVMAPVREDPVKLIGMIFAGALVLGFLSGGGKKGRNHRGRAGHEEVDVDLNHSAQEERLQEEAELAWSRAETWEDRAHRLLRIAKAQESELDIHRSRRESILKELRALRHRARREEEYAEEMEDELEPNLVQRAWHSAADRLTGLANEVSYRMMRGA